MVVALLRAEPDGFFARHLRETHAVGCCEKSTELLNSSTRPGLSGEGGWKSGEWSVGGVAFCLRLLCGVRQNFRRFSLRPSPDQPAAAFALGKAWQGARLTC